MTRSRIIDTEIVELSRTIQAVTEEAGANTLPITGAHREGIASECKILAIGAVVELVDIVQTVVGNAQIKLVKVSIQHWVDIGAVTLITPSQIFRVYADKVRTGIGMLRQYLNVLKLYVTGMTNEKALGGQVAPHRGLRILLLFFVFQHLVNLRKVGQPDATLLVKTNVRQPDILHGIPRQSRDTTANGACTVNLDIIETNTIDTPYMLDRNQFGNRVFITIATQRALPFS